MLKLHYFNGTLSPGFVALYTGRMIQLASNAMIGLFLPVFLLTHFGMRADLVMIWYLAGHLIYALILPIGVRALNRIGLRRSLRLSVFFDAAYLTCAIFIGYNPWLFATLSGFFVVLARLFFWMPYHIDFAKLTDRSNRGKEVGLIWATHSLLGILMPIASGFLIGYFSFTVVFIIAVTLYLTSAIPFLFLPRTGERFEWGYFQTFRNFFKKENRGLVFANMANGAENAVALVIWPIFIWQTLAGNYLAVGALSSMIILVGMVIQLIAGKYTDLVNKRSLLHWGSTLYAIGWFAKIFVLTGFHAFFAGAYHQLAQIFKDTPFDTLNYEMLSDRGHYVDEYTVLKEIAVQAGKAIILIFAILVALKFGLNWTFALAALASLFINLL